MTPSESRERPGASPRIVAAAVLMLIGIVLVGFGIDSEYSLTFYAGLLITLAGVITGIMALIVWRKDDNPSGRE